MQTALRGHDFVDGEFPEGDFFWLAALQAARAPVMEQELHSVENAFDQVLPGVDGSTFIVRQRLGPAKIIFHMGLHGPTGHVIVELPYEARSTATHPSSS